MQILPEHFSTRTTLTRPRRYILTCRKCGKEWELDPHARKHPGNLLRLLNHARSHNHKD